MRGDKQKIAVSLFLVVTFPEVPFPVKWIRLCLLYMNAMNYELKYEGS